MEETKKEGYWENKDSKGPLHILKKKKKIECHVHSQDGMHTQERFEMSFSVTSGDAVGSTQVEVES